MFAAHTPPRIESPNLDQDNDTSVPATTPSVEGGAQDESTRSSCATIQKTGESTRPIAVSDDL